MADLDKKSYEEIARAQRARELLDDPLLSGAFEEEEKAVLDMMANTHDSDQVLKLHRAFVWGRRMKQRLQAHVETGKLAAFQLEEKRKFKLWSR